MASVIMKYIFAAALLGATNSAFAESIDIKGIHIGMTETELSKKYPSWDGFTVGGTPSKHQDLPVTLSFYEGRLDNFAFFFDPDGFDNVLAAVKKKFPNIFCLTSSVSNAMGASFSQVTCMMRDSTSHLYLSRYVSDIQTSVLSLASERSMKESDKTQREKQKDI